MLQPLPRPPRRHSQRLAVPASAQPPTLLVAHIEGIQVSCHIVSPPGLHMSRNIEPCSCAAASCGARGYPAVSLAECLLAQGVRMLLRSEGGPQCMHFCLNDLSLAYSR